MKERHTKRGRERGQLSILRHDFSEDTVHLCIVVIGEWPRRDRERRGVRERARGRQQRKRLGQTNGCLVSNSRAFSNADNLAVRLGTKTSVLFSVLRVKKPRQKLSPDVDLERSA